MPEPNTKCRDFQESHNIAKELHAETLFKDKPMNLQPRRGKRKLLIHITNTTRPYIYSAPIKIEQRIPTYPKIQRIYLPPLADQR